MASIYIEKQLEKIREYITDLETPKKENDRFFKERNEARIECQKLEKRINKAIDTLETIPYKDDVIKSAIEILKSND